MTKFGHEVFGLNKFTDYINDAYGNSHDNQQFLADLVTGFTVDWLVGLIPGGNVKDQALGNVPVVNPDNIKDFVGKLMVSIPESAETDPKAYLRIAGLTTILASLVAQGRITNRLGTRPSWTEVQNDPGFKTLMLNFGPSDAPYDDEDKNSSWKAEKNKGRHWAAQFNVDGQSLEAFVDNFDFESQS